MSRGLGKTQNHMLAYMEPRRWYGVPAITSWVYMGADTASHRTAVRRALASLQRKGLVVREDKYPHRWRHTPLRASRPRMPHSRQLTFFELTTWVDGSLNYVGGGLERPLPFRASTA